MAIFFTADLHLNHHNIIRHTARPFHTVEGMNEALARNWNAVVSPQDTVYLLGDVLWGQPKRLVGLLDSLNGTIHLITGNHDKRLAREGTLGVGRRFQTIESYQELTIDKTFIVMSHYPFLSWNRKSYGAWMLHGHCHGALETANAGLRRLDVGVDPHGYIPVPFGAVRRLLCDRSVGCKPRGA